MVLGGIKFGTVQQYCSAVHQQSVIRGHHDIARWIWLEQPGFVRDMIRANSLPSLNQQIHKFALNML